MRALVLCLLASPVAAQDVDVLSTHGDWEVLVTQKDGGMLCAAGTSTIMGAEFYLRVTDTGRYSLGLFFPMAFTETAAADLSVDFGDMQWGFDDAPAFQMGHGVGVSHDLGDSGDETAFVGDVMFSRHADVAVPGFATQRFSLLGSSEAMSALHTCAAMIRRLPGEPA